MNTPHSDNIIIESINLVRFDIPNATHYWTGTVDQSGQLFVTTQTQDQPAVETEPLRFNSPAAALAQLEALLKQKQLDGYCLFRRKTDKYRIMSVNIG